MEREKLQGHAQVLAQSAAFLVLVFYVAGFLVVSIRHALLGIVQFGLLRARILSAGILFAVFFAVAIIPAARVFGLFGYEEWDRLRVADMATAGRRLVFRWVSFFVAELAFCLAMRVFLEEPLHWTVTSWLLLVSAFLSSWVGRLQYDKRPRVSVFLGLAAISLILVLVYRFKDFGLWALLTWFTWIALMAQLINPPLRDPGKLRHLNWEICLGSSIGTIALFAVFLYPKIWPAIGGGVPVPVTMQFSDKSPLDGSNRSQVWLIDETDLGFYVLTAEHQGKAVFLPRNLVSAVYFGETSTAPKPAQPNAGTGSGQPQPNVTPEKAK
jgi:hypothetical protein